ncbi:cilia- and flagella-associated protein 157-like [Cololabis saira]|uniref:cilia- and flagella-associated protein 157-like n=1 Tax=Cololabis saira TaxID=129043 RepID=UPI002AD46121|nr:cilia- and flagella-associated protein 157-like [Cololabis saira]
MAKDEAGKEKELYITQMKHLEENLKRSELRRDALRKENKECTIHCNKQEQDDRDETLYLTHRLSELKEDKEEVVGLLEKEQLLAKQFAEADELLMSQERQETQELQERIDHLTSTLDKQAAQEKEQNAELEELTQKQSSLSCEELAAQLAALHNEHKTAVEKLKHNKAKRRNEMENEMKQAVKLEAQAALKLKRRQHKMDEMKAYRVLPNPKVLKQQKMSLKKRLVALHKEEETEQIVLSKNIKMISDLEKEKEVLTGQIQKLQDEMKASVNRRQALLEKNEAFRQDQAEEQIQFAVKQAELVSQLEQERSEVRKLERVMKQGTANLTTVLKKPERRSYVGKKMEEVLKALESACPEAASEKTATPDRDPLFLLAKYSPGDDGFVPRPTWNPKTRSNGTVPPHERESGCRRTSGQRDGLAYRRAGENFRLFQDKYM